MKLIPALATTLLLVLLAPSLAWAQLDLPDKPVPVKAGPGVDLQGKPRGDLAPKKAGSGPVGGLEIPPAPAAPAPAPVAERGPTSAPDAVFRELALVRDAGGERVRDAAGSLVSMGAEGLAAAREGLGREEAAIFMASARALLVGGSKADDQLVLERIRRRVPTRAATAVVDLVAETHAGDPGIDFLFELCDHRQGGVRRHAAKQLATRDVGLGRLLGLAASPRTEARELAYQMMARLEDVGALGLDEHLIGGLSDPSARVASAASEALSTRIEGPGGSTSARLLQLARLRGLDDMRGGFALLALVEAEDRLGVALVPFDESVNLIVHMRSGQPFVQAIAAIALAGIGFRAEESAPWLDLEVPHTLVASVAGELYFPEYAIVRPAALRRLEMITGQSFGDEGPLWKSWWVANARAFHSLRAVLPVSLADYEQLEVRWMDPLRAEGFRLLGPAADAGSVPYPGLSLRLVPEESRALMLELLEAKVFGAERLPGLVGRANGVEQQLEVRIGGASKAFRFGEGASVAWAQGLFDSVRRLAAGAEWQLYPSPGFEDAGPGAFFDSEAPWWIEHQDPGERAQRLAHLIVTNMKLHAPLERGPAVASLERLPDGALTQALFDSLADRLSEEDFFGDRARRLLAVTLIAGRDADGRLSRDVAGRLMDILVASGDAGRMQLMAEVLAATTPAFRREAALDPRSGVRAVAATVIARRPQEPEDRALLRALLTDSSPEVEAATVLAVSDAGLTEFRDEVQMRARVGDTSVRRAALRGVGRLGGQGALDVLRLAVLDPDTGIKLAGAEALSDLADEASTTLLVQMLASGETGPFFVPARRGLVRIGEPAWDALLLMARNSTSPASRAAMLMLAEQEATAVATILMTALTEDPSDAVVARELAVMTGEDYRNRPDPAGDWWAWHDVMRGADSMEWFCDAYNGLVEAGQELDLAAGGVHLEPSLLRGKGTLAGAQSLVELLRVDAPAHLVTRATRELKRLVGQDLGSLPPPGRLRREWCDVILKRLPIVLPGEPLAPAEAASGVND